METQNRKKKILILFSSYSERENLEFIRSHAMGNPVLSSLVFSRKLLKGALSNYDETFVFSSPPIGSYPNHSDILLFKGFDAVNNVITPPHLNVVLLRNPSIARGLIKSFEKCKKQGFFRNSIVDVVAVEAHTPFLKAAMHAKKTLPSSSLTLIVLDLPNAMNPFKHSFLYSIAKSVDNKKIVNMSKHVDGFVFLSKGMADYFKPNERPFFVSEGIYDSFHSNENVFVKNRVVYTGLINETYSGIVSLLMADTGLLGNPNVDFIIAGSGDNQKLFDLSKKYENIKFLGSVSDDEAKQIQETASVLVNPRPISPSFAESFPSKLIDYVSTGNPVVTFKLKGIPPDYDDLLIYPKSSNYQSFIEKVKECLSFSQMERDFIKRKSKLMVENKNSVSFVMKIVELANKERQKQGR